MFVNPLTAAQGALELFNTLTSSRDKKDEKATVMPSNTSYDVHHMSLEDLKAMTTDLWHKGTLSEKDANHFLAQIASLQQATGLSKDTKVDMIQLYQQQIQNLNGSANPNELASFQHSLDLLNGIQARTGANIPQSV